MITAQIIKASGRGITLCLDNQACGKVVIGAGDVMFLVTLTSVV